MGDVWAGLNYCYNPEAFKLRRGHFIIISFSDNYYDYYCFIISIISFQKPSIFFFFFFFFSKLTFLFPSIRSLFPQSHRQHLKIHPKKRQSEEMVGRNEKIRGQIIINHQLCLRLQVSFPP